jgi:hypothetical protein
MCQRIPLRAMLQISSCLCVQSPAARIAREPLFRASNSSSQMLFGFPPAITNLPSQTDYFTLPTATVAPIAMAANPPPGSSVFSSESCDALASTCLWQTPLSSSLTESLSGSKHQSTDAAVLDASPWQRSWTVSSDCNFSAALPHDLGPEFQDLRPPIGTVMRVREAKSDPGSAD